MHYANEYIVMVDRDSLEKLKMIESVQDQETLTSIERWEKPVKSGEADVIFFILAFLSFERHSR